MEEKERLNSGGAVKVWLDRALEELSFSLDKHYDSRLILRHHSDTNIGKYVTFLSLIPKLG